MRRYAETFFRYWLLLILPIIALPAATYAMVRHAPKTVVASANILVGQSLAGPSSDWSQWLTAAQNEAASLNQMLQSPSFDLTVAHTSPVYAQALNSGRISPSAAVADISSHVQIAPKGPSLLSVSYSSTYADLAVQVVNSVLGTARDQAHMLSKQQTESAITVYNYQLQNAKEQLAQSTATLKKYMDAHGIAPDELTAQMAVDPALATLYHQNQDDQAAVTDLQQKITTYRTQTSLPADLVAQGSFTVVDQPSITVLSSKKTQIMQLAIALVVGLLMAGIFLVVKTAPDRSLRYADEVEEMLGLPVLSVVPYKRTLDVRHVAPPQVAAKATRRGPLGLLRTGS